MKKSANITPPSEIVLQERQSSRHTSLKAGSILWGRLKLSDDNHMNRIRRLATRLGIYDCMFEEGGRLLNPETDPRQNTPGTRTQLIADIVSWIQNPLRVGNTLELVGLDSDNILGTVYHIVKHSRPTSFLGSISDRSCSQNSASRIPALVALAIAVQDEDLARHIEYCISHVESETLLDLWFRLLTGSYTSKSSRSGHIVMFNTRMLELSPELLQIIYGTQTEYPVPVLWVLFSIHPCSLYPGPLVSSLITLSAPPLTHVEKEIVLQCIQDTYLKGAERRSGGEPVLVPVDVVDSCLSYPPENASEFGWELNVPGLINAATSYIQCFRILGLALNQEGQQGLDDADVFQHPFSGQYLPLVSLANNGVLGPEQFVLVMVLFVNRLWGDWSECTCSFFFDAFDVFRDGTLGFSDLTNSNAFLALFMGYEPRTECPPYLRSRELVDYLEEIFHDLIQPISNLALVPPLLFACLSTLETRPIDRVLFAAMRFGLDVLHLHSSTIHLHQDIHRGLWRTLPTITFWDDPKFLSHFGLVLPLMQFHTHSIPVDDFLKFVFHFREREVPTGFVRVQISSWLDRDLVHACGSMARPLDFKCQFYAEFRKFLDDGEAGYTLLGFPTDPILCIIVKEAVTVYTHATLAEL
ncbi:hypothetical protein NP233_g12013 [Leucocoprinus birnbaumii]|uniref:Uncharacterized protein n=1 Tax=Leucocoprinus birnbaumii TaxID=56174 RepID=A0AAD5VGF2_9AGAR|nr:hypothetical protein NP233_g12013 [Leucocoprinus birnbaumii]